jgi:hypothetical protein
MLGVTAKAFARATEVRTLPNTIAQIIELPSQKVARFQLEPGWSWAVSVAPTVGGTTCQQRHVGVLVHGNMHVIDKDGVHVVIQAGDAYEIESGHLAEVEGNQAVIAYEFEPRAAESYGLPM